MNEYGIFRQYKPPYDLIGLPFDAAASFCDAGASFEVLHPEWTEGSYYSSGAGASSNAASMMKAVVDLTGYDVVLVGISSDLESGTAYSGIRAAADSGTFPTQIALKAGAFAGYAMFNVSTNVYLLASMAIANELPIIGIKMPA